VSSPGPQASSSGNRVTSFPDISNLEGQLESPAVRTANGLTAFSFEFVAKPEQAASAPLLLPAAIQSGLEDVGGFAGTLVMVSDQEARLVTVVTFWNGTEARKSCDQSLRRVGALIAPYLDRCLRVQTSVAHLTVTPAVPKETGPIGAAFTLKENIDEEANFAWYNASY
jgi:hypothetical protein